MNKHPGQTWLYLIVSLTFYLIRGREPGEAVAMAIYTVPVTYAMLWMGDKLVAFVSSRWEVKRRARS